LKVSIRIHHHEIRVLIAIPDLEYEHPKAVIENVTSRSVERSREVKSNKAKRNISENRLRRSLSMNESNKKLEVVC
uniref:Ovule protein n=1 Tax=Anisakis simplex TaxID=6269 RepID=A0A0M3JLE2_ANISI